MAKQCVIQASAAASGMPGQKMALIGSVLTQAPIAPTEAPAHQVIQVNGLTMDCFVRDNQQRQMAAATQPIIYTGIIEGPKTITESQTHFEVVTHLQPKYTVHTTSAVQAPVEPSAPVAESVPAVEVAAVPQQQTQQVTMNIPTVQMVVPMVAAPQATQVAFQTTPQQTAQYGSYQFVQAAQPQLVKDQTVKPSIFLTPATVGLPAPKSFLQSVSAPVNTGLTLPTFQGVQAATVPAFQGVQAATVPAFQGVQAATVPAFQGVQTATVPAFQGVQTATMPLEVLCQQYFNQMQTADSSFNAVTFTRELAAMKEDELLLWLGQRGFLDNPTHYVLGADAMRALILEYVEKGGVAKFDVVYTPEVVRDLLDFYAGGEEAAPEAAPSQDESSTGAADATQGSKRSDLAKLLSELVSGN